MYRVKMYLKIPFAFKISILFYKLKNMFKSNKKNKNVSMNKILFY